MSEHGDVELSGPDDGGWYTSQTSDWIPLCPQLSDSMVRLYWIMRSLVIEKHGPVRKLSLAELCYLLPAKPAEPGKPVKPSSISRIRTLLSGLTAVGLVTTPEGKPLKTSSRAKAAAAGPLRIRVNDRPFPEYTGPRNAFAVLASVREEAQLAATAAARREAQLEADRKAAKRAQKQLPEAGQISDPPGAGQISNPAGQISNPRGQKSDPDSGADLQDREPPFILSVQSSLSSHHSTASPSGTGGEEERDAAAPQKPAALPEVPQPRAEEPAQDQNADRVVEAYVAACRNVFVPAVGMVKTQIHAQALELLAGGCPVQWLADRAAEMPANRWTDLELHASRSKVPMSTAVERREADLDCPTCCGSGLEEVEGQRTGRPCPCLSAPAPAAAGAR